MCIGTKYNMDVCIRLSDRFYSHMPTVQSVVHSMAVANMVEDMEKHRALNWMLMEIARIIMGWQKEIGLTITSAVVSHKNGSDMTGSNTLLLDCEPTQVELLKALFLDMKGYDKIGGFGDVPNPIPTDGVHVVFTLDEDNLGHSNKFPVMYKVVEIPPSVPVPAPVGPTS